jgi:hypothetical protein
MIFGKNKNGRKVGVLALTPETIIKRPIEDLGAKLKAALIEAEAEGAVTMWVHVRLEGANDDD